MQSYKVTEKIYLTKLMGQKGYSYSLSQKLLRKKDIKVNGKRINEDCQLSIGDKVDIFYDLTEELSIVYEDENILILDKRQGIESVDLHKQVLKKYPTAIFTHRLDRNTGGLIIFALNQTSYQELYVALKERVIKKYYLARVYGCVEKDFDELVAYCKKDSKNSFVSVFSNKVVGGKKMVTKYQVVNRFKNYTDLLVELVTGRTHQIRCHLSFIGHFILGDGKYGKESINKEMGYKVQQLFAYKIKFNFKESSLSYLNDKIIQLNYQPLNK